MSRLQQAAHATYDSLPESHFIKKSIAIAKQQKAKWVIRKSPTKAKGYLELAKLYIEQNTLRAALETYDNGIAFIQTFLDRINNSNSVNDAINHKFNTSSWIPFFSSAKKNDNIIIGAEQQLAILKKERQNILATLRHNQGFHQALPYDVLYEIFGYLNNFKDLWQCGNVCKRWHHFMVTWPLFWNSISSAETPQEEKSTVVIADLCKATHTIYLNGPLNPLITLSDIFNILSLAATDQSIEKLCMKNIELNSADFNDFGGVMKSMLKSNPNFKQTELISCRFSRRTMVTSVIKFSPYDNPIPNNDNMAWKEKLKKIEDLDSTFFPKLPNPYSAIVLSTLTYLKLFVGPFSRTYKFHEETKSRGATILGRYILTRCPHLIHLFLDGKDAKLDLGFSAAMAFKHCPQLRNVVLGNNAQMPKTIIDGLDDDSEYNDDGPFNSMRSNNALTVLSTSDNLQTPEKIYSLPSSTTTAGKKGLRRLVILNTHIHENQHNAPDCNFQRTNRNHWNQCLFQLNKLNRDSLELLFMLCNTTTIQGLHRWCDDSVIAPNLRELHLADRPLFHPLVNKNRLDNEYISGKIHSKNSLLGKLLPLLPALEALVVIQTFNIPNEQYLLGKRATSKKSYVKEHLVFDDVALQQLIKHCRRIRHLKIVGSPSCTRQAVLSLSNQQDDSVPDSITDSFISRSSSSTATKLPIAYLEMDMHRDIVLQLIKEMESLKYLKVRMDRDIIREMNPMALNDQLEAESLLHKRGGALTIIDEYDNTLMYDTL